jgi:hypothetical protein
MVSTSLFIVADVWSILGVEPAPSRVVSILLADGTRIETIMNHSHNTSVSVMSR